MDSKANGWIYDHTRKGTDLDSIWRNNLPGCVQRGKHNLKFRLFLQSDIHPTTTYTGPEAESLFDKIGELKWLRNSTEFVSRFESAGQYMIGASFCSAYHLGDGYVGTANYTLEKVLIDEQLDELRVGFNWVGNVGCKKTFTE